MTRCTSFDDLSRKMGKKIGRIVDSVKSVNGKGISVGISADAKYPNGKNVSEVARLVEFGTEYMPPRPFMRVAAIEHGKEWNRMLAERCADIMTGKGGNYKQALEAVGRVAANDVKDQITAMAAVDTGRLRDSIEARIVA